MRVILHLGLILSLWLPVVAVPALAQQKVVVGVFENNPIVFKSHDQRYRGISIDVLEDIARLNNWQLEYRYASWHDLLGLLDKAEINVLVGIAYTEERAQRFNFTQQTLLNNWGLVYQSSKNEITSIPDLQGKRIALMNESIHSIKFAELMQQFGVSYTPIPVKDYTAVFQAVEDKQADAGVANRIYSLLNAHHYQLKPTGILFNPVEVRFAAPRQQTEIISIIDDYLKVAKLDQDSRYYQSISNWLDDTHGLAVPAWIWWPIGTVLLVLSLVSVYGFLIRREVDARTRQLTESEARFRQLAESITEVFWIGSPDWQQVYYISPAYETVWGKSVESLYADPMSWAESIHPDDVEKVRNTLVSKVDVPFTRFTLPEYRIVRPDGSLRWILARAYPVLDHKGKVVRVAGIAEDITNRMQLDLELSESRHMLQLILDTIPTRVFWKDKNSVYLGCNKMFAKDAGLQSAEQIIGKTDFDFSWAEQAEIYRHDDQQVMTTQQAKLHYEEPQTTPSGKHIWLETSKIPLTDSEGNLIGMLGTYNDITARKQTENALTKSRAQFQAIFNSMLDAIIFKDTDRRIVMTNPAVTEVFGYRFEEIEGKTTELFYPDKQSYVEQGRQRFRDDVEVEQPIYEMQYKRKNGEVFTGETLGTQVKDAAGNVLGFIGVIRDISERERTLRALQESESRYHTLARTAPVGIYRTDAKGECIYVNERWCEIAGMTMQEALGTGWHAAIHPQDRAQVTEAWNHAAAEGKMFQLEYRFQRPDGTVTWLLGQAHAEFNVDNDLVGYVGTITDIMAVHQAQDVQRRLAQIFDASVNEIYMFDTESLKFMLVNQAALNNLGYNLEEMQQRTPVDIKPEFDEQQFRQLIAPLREDKTNLLVFETLHERKDGTTYPVEVRLQKLPTETSPMYMAVILDISLRKQAEQELKNLNVELEARVEERTARLADVNRELEAFSYSVSHDLRAPLRAIDGFSNALYDDYEKVLDASGKEYINRVRKAAQHMSSLIDDLLKLARVTRSELDWQPVNLSKMALHALRRHQEMEPERQVDVSVEPDLSAFGDKRLLQLLIDNLIDNAWKYTRNCTIARLEFGRQIIDNKEVIYIRDNGAGFDMQYADKLFGAFQRLHQADEFEGTGIGLATVQRIINRHGGRIWAESVPQQGTTFYFTLGSQVNQHIAGS